jgi:hypothetical protein
VKRSGRGLALYWKVRRYFTGRVSRGIRAVHATGRSAHRHQYGQDRHRRTGAARRTRHAHHLHQRQPSGREGTHHRRGTAVKHQRVASGHRQPQRQSGWLPTRASQRTSFRFHDDECPLWVISGHFAMRRRCPFYPESRHWRCTNQCPLRANSGHWTR